ncbi:hypothetical protein ASG49_06305 [Marmoricola sp. Leaf446]|uniref:phosphotransferase n=1 Tax=Marmoricola sp. Leaf446 TaxID=1736379 RepID=UPI0006F52ADF|nr:phosphotransferase [Marmoricola sp. Leaf446]KQT94480.1 hypothetical protein ASG49_06305 [Marmoricola sp. Leaf446]
MAHTTAPAADALEALGPAAVDADTLTGLVAALLGEPPGHVRLRGVTVDPVDYELDAITTAARHWVRGEAVVSTGSTNGGPGSDTDAVRPWSVFVKQVQCWSRHPAFAAVPPEMRELAAAGLPWRTEPLAYRSDLGARLPEGLAMPRALLVEDLDELSAAVWLPEVATRLGTWGLERYVSAAHLLGRLAASPAVREAASRVGHGLSVWSYLHGRLAGQVLPALLDDGLWEHPLLAGPFDEVRERLRDAARRAEALTAELAAVPLLAAHGDACPHNLLTSPGVEGFVLIDYGFFGAAPVGFDLAQLLVGEVQTGHCAEDLESLATRDEACLAAYVTGLRAEGDDTPTEVVRRAHALQLVLYAGLSSLPFEHLGSEPTPALVDLARQRAVLAAYSLDLLDRTGTHDGP